MIPNNVGLEFAGFQKYLLAAPESTWGQTPSSPAWLYIPYTEYNVLAKPQVYAPQLFTGLYERRDSRITHTMLDGPLSVPLFGYQVAGQSIAQYLINWAWFRSVSPIYQASYVIQVNENAVDNKQHNGVRVGSFTLSGDNQSGIVNFQAQLMGSLETGGIALAQAVPVTTPQPGAFLYKDITLTLNDGTGNVSFFPRSFSLSVNQNLQPEFTNSQWPTLLHSGMREVTFSFVLFKNSNYWDIFNRGLGSQNINATLTMLGVSEGTGPGTTTFTTVQAFFPRLSFTQETLTAALNPLVEQTIAFNVLKPDTAQDEIVWTFGNQ